MVAVRFKTSPVFKLLVAPAVGVAGLEHPDGLVLVSLVLLHEAKRTREIVNIRKVVFMFSENDLRRIISFNSFGKCNN